MCSCRSSVTKRSQRSRISSGSNPPAGGLRRKKAAAKYSTLPVESGSGRTPLIVGTQPREESRVVRVEPVRPLEDGALVRADAERRAVEDRERHRSQDASEGADGPAPGGRRTDRRPGFTFRCDGHLLLPVLFERH